MGKVKGSKNNTVTKVLYKKSYVTIRTHSRSALSDASQLTKSGILQIKKNLSKSTNYYTDGNKVMRDLSVETNTCALRRYYKSKHKRDRCSIQASSAKSKCSTVHSEFPEFKPDLACGDSRNKFDIVNPTNALNIDITSLMVDNLKSLLNDWIRKHVLEDTGTKKKFVNVLDSIMKSLDAKVPSTRSSCCTYVIERNGEGYKVRNRKTETNSITCQYCKKKQTSLITDTCSSVIFKKYSRFTIPFPYKHLRIISTLSIPRNMYKKDKCKKKHLVYKVKRMQKNDASLSSNKKERKVVINVSSCAMSNVSKKSFKTVRKGHEKKSSSKKKAIIFLPQMFYKSTTDFTSATEIDDEKQNKETQESQLDAMPSLVKSIYADDPANVTSTDKMMNTKNRNDNFTMTETNISYSNFSKLINTESNVHFHEAKYEYYKTERNPNVTNQTYESHAKVNVINQSKQFPNLTVTKQKSIERQTKISHNITKSKSRKKDDKMSRKCKISTPKSNTKCIYKNIKYKQFTYLYNKNKKRVLQDGDIVNHFRKVFKYFADHEGKRNIKLEIHCNVYPLFEMEETLLNTSNAYQEYEINTIPTEMCKIESKASMHKLGKEHEHITIMPELNAGIIPILDGAASQAKYIFKSVNSTSTSNHSLGNTGNTERGTLMTSLEVTKELGELKSAIKDFSATAEKLVHEHLKKQSLNFHQLSSGSSKKIVESQSSKPSKEVEKKVTKLSNNTSKGIQFSNTPKGQLLSGIKLSKGPKKTEELNNRLKKRSSSYHVIESESILRVTDMTASVNKSKESNKPSTVKKSKSLLNMTNEANKQKLLAFFCSNGRNNMNDRLTYKFCSGNKPSFVCPGPQPQATPCNVPCCKSRSNTSKLMLPVTVSDYQGCGHDYCSSVYVEIDKPTITVKKKGGLPWWEGFIYCILLWIPVIVIMVLFYQHVLKDNSKPQNSTQVPDEKPKHLRDVSRMDPIANSSRFFLKMSDFGF